MRITITIDTNNAAWEDDSQQLRKIMSHTENYLSRLIYSSTLIEAEHVLHDVNGNKTGLITIGPRLRGEV